MLSDFRVDDIMVINGVKYKRVGSYVCHICGKDIDFESKHTYEKDGYYFCHEKCIEEYCLDDKVDEDVFRIMGRKTLVDIGKFYGIYRYDEKFDGIDGLLPRTITYPEARIVHDIINSPIPITNRMLKRFKEYRKVGFEV